MEETRGKGVSITVAHACVHTHAQTINHSGRLLHLTLFLLVKSYKAGSSKYWFSAVEGEDSGLNMDNRLLETNCGNYINYTGETEIRLLNCVAIIPKNLQTNFMDDYGSAFARN